MTDDAFDPSGRRTDPTTRDMDTAIVCSDKVLARAGNDQEARHDNQRSGDDMFLTKRTSLMQELTERVQTAENDVAVVHRHLAVIEFAPGGTIIGTSDGFNRVMGVRGAQIRGCHHRVFCEAA